MNKKAFGFLSISILVVVLAVPLPAQSLRMTANVPFEFMVGAMTLRAGEYSISLDSFASPGVVQLRSFDGRRGAISQTQPVDVRGKDPAAATKLVFNRYGDRYFLSEVCDGYDSVGRIFPVSHAERELAKSEPLQAPEIVAVLARR